MHLPLHTQDFTGRIGDDRPAPFLVTCCGQAGAIWLGQALHKHPDIVCTSGTDHPLMSMNYDYNENEILQIRAGIRTPADIPFGVTSGLAAALGQGGFFNYGGKVQNKHRDIFEPLAMDANRKADYIPYIFDELDQLPLFKHCKAYGNVRGVTAGYCASELQKAEKAFNGRGNSFPVADLTRDPIVRLETTIHFCLEIYSENTSQIDSEIQNNHALLEAIEQEYHVSISAPLDIAFFYIEILTRHSFSWADDIRLSPMIPRVLFEKLHSDRDYFATFVDYITGGRVAADEAYLDWVFNPAHVDKGRVSNAKTRKNRRTAQEIYESWPRWQQEHISRTFKTFDIASVYEPLGYDFSYLRPV